MCVACLFFLISCRFQISNHVLSGEIEAETISSQVCSTGDGLQDDGLAPGKQAEVPVEDSAHGLHKKPVARRTEAIDGGGRQEDNRSRGATIPGKAEEEAEADRRGEIDQEHISVRLH